MVLGLQTAGKLVAHLCKGKGGPTRSQRDEMAKPDVACEAEMQGVDKRDKVRRGSQRAARPSARVGLKRACRVPRAAGEECVWSGRPGLMRGGARGAIAALCACRAGLWGVRAPRGR